MSELMALSRNPPMQPAPPEADRSPTRAERLTDLSARLSRTLALARALVQGGRTVDLTGIDDGIGILCAQTLDLPPAEAREMLPVLHQVLEQLDLLALCVHATARPDNAPC